MTTKSNSWSRRRGLAPGFSLWRHGIAGDRPSDLLRMQANSLDYYPIQYTFPRRPATSGRDFAGCGRTILRKVWLIAKFLRRVWIIASNRLETKQRHRTCKGYLTGPLELK